MGSPTQSNWRSGIWICLVLTLLALLIMAVWG